MKKHSTKALRERFKGAGRRNADGLRFSFVLPFCEFSTNELI
jgi:hypothetical protein